MKVLGSVAQRTGTQSAEETCKVLRYCKMWVTFIAWFTSIHSRTFSFVMISNVHRAWLIMKMMNILV